jgi:hypothetical protein
MTVQLSIPRSAASKLHPGMHSPPTRGQKDERDYDSTYSMVWDQLCHSQFISSLFDFHRISH